MPYLILVIAVFSVLSCMMSDPVASKPWLALSGVVSAGLGVVTAHGLLFALSIPLIQIAMITPFLVLGRAAFLIVLHYGCILLRKM